MSNLIAKREYTSLVKSSLFKGVLAIGWLFYIFALYNGITYFNNNSETRNKAQEETYQQWLNQEDKGPHSAAHYGFYAYKPVPILSIMDKGMEDFLGTATWLEAHNQNDVIMKAVDNNNSLVKYSSITVGFLWQFIFPLLLLVITFNSITKERENGTLTILMSTGISGRYIISGKVWGALKGFMSYMFFPQVIVLVIFLLINSQENITRELLFLGVIVFFYVVMYIMVANLVVYLSSISKTSSQVLVFGLSFWIVTLFILPRLYGSIAKHIYTTPSSYEFTEVVQNQRSKGMDGKGSYEKFQQQLKDSLFHHYKVDKIEDLPIGFAGIALEKSEKRDYASYDKNYGEVQSLFNKQDKFISLGSLFSPLLAMRNLSFGFSETDIYKHFEFTNQAEAHRRMIATKMNNDIIKNGSSIGKKEGYKYNANKELWKTVDNFTYDKPSFMQVLKNQWINIMSIFIWLGMVLWLRTKAEQNLKPL